MNNNLIHDPIELIGDTVSIRRNSAYHERVLSLSNEIGGDIFIDTLDSKLSTGEIIDMVVDKKIKYTIADENLARINASNNPILNINVPISLSQQIAWVTRKKSEDFRAVVNEWIINQKKKTSYHVIYNKYFKNRRSFKRRIKSEYYSLNNNQISKYDDLIKEQTKKNRVSTGDYWLHRFTKNLSLIQMQILGLEQKGLCKLCLILQMIWV